MIVANSRANLTARSRSINYKNNDSLTDYVGGRNLYGGHMDPQVMTGIIFIIVYIIIVTISNKIGDKNGSK